MTVSPQPGAAAEEELRQAWDYVFSNRVLRTRFHVQRVKH